MDTVGQCCLCKGECNSASQACGHCMRLFPCSDPIFEDDFSNIGSSDMSSPIYKKTKQTKLEKSVTPFNTPVVSLDKIDNFPYIPERDTGSPINFIRTPPDDELQKNKDEQYKNEQRIEECEECEQLEN